MSISARERLGTGAGIIGGGRSRGWDAGTAGSGQFSTQVLSSTSGGAGADVCAGVSTRKVAAITAELCGHEFSASIISTITQRLDEQLEQFSQRTLTEFPYVVGCAV